MRLCSVALSPDNKTIALGDIWSDGGGHLEIWDGVAGKKLYSWGSATIYRLKFSDDAKTLEIVRGPKPKS